MGNGRKAMNDTILDTWRPAGKRASVSVTLDNLGEACDINMGRWPADEPVGRHYTATRVLPRLLEALDGVAVTYFVEAVNVARYPEQLHALCEAGHEVALHTWGHENWGRLAPDERRANLARSLAAFQSVGIEPVGFRPPGGAADADSLALLRDNGFTYCSPASRDRAVRNEYGLAILPFAWRHVDAYLIDPDLAAFRASNGDRETPATPDEWAGILDAAFDAALSAGEHLTVIFHPYVFGADERLWNVFSAFMRKVRAHDDVWLAPCREIAQRHIRFGPAAAPLRASQT